MLTSISKSAMVISRRSRPAWIFPIPLSVHQRLAACSQSTDAKPESKTKPPATAAEKLSVAEIELRDIHLSFGKKRVLRGLNLSIRKGEATAIIGTSGTGYVPRCSFKFALCETSTLTDKQKIYSSTRNDRISHASHWGGFSARMETNSAYCI